MMAVPSLAKSAQTMRRQRLSLNTRPTSRTVNSTDDVGLRKLSEPYVRDTDFILRKFNGRSPSLVVHLHSTYFRFEQQDGSFAYDSPMKFILKHLQQQTIPHDMLNELLDRNVPFYDGCLIVEVHDHRSTVKTANGAPPVDPNDKTVPYSMHNYNEHVTPSPFVPYPTKSNNPALFKSPSQVEMAEQQENDKKRMPAPAPVGKQAKEGPKTYTLVLHPTDMSKHYDMLRLAETALSDARTSKKGALSRDGLTPSNAPPQTPLSALPQTPTSASRALPNKKPKMILEEKDLYSFQADLLVATEPPLLLDPAANAEEAERALDLLRHPLHSHAPPSSPTRKRTHAEMAADDAQAAEEERRMLVMDERVKPAARSGNAAAENQGGTAAMGFSRFKTLETIKQRREDQERTRKEEEARAAVEKRQHDMALAQKRKLLDDRTRQDLAQKMRQQQLQNQQLQNQQLQNQQLQNQQLQAQAQMHAHPGSGPGNAMATNLQQQQLQQQAALAQHSSPVARQQTPMMISSPMVNNGAGMPPGSYPMAANMSNQGAGSPHRPMSAMQHSGVNMVRQASQQQIQTRHHTPQMAGNTPNLTPAVPIDMARQLSATPHMAHVSPAQGMQGMQGVQGMQGTPGQVMMNTPQMNQQQMTPQQQQQMLLIAQRRQQQQVQAHQAMQNGQGQPLTQEQLMRRHQQQQLALQQQQQQQQQQQMNPQAYQQSLQRMQQQQMAAMQRGAAGGEAMQQTPSQASQMVQQHSQQGMSADPAMMQQRQQHQQQLQLRAQQHQQMLQQRNAVLQLAAQNGGELPQHVRQQLHTQQQRNLAQQQITAMRNNNMPNLGDPNNREQYMANLRNQQALLAQMPQNPQQQNPQRAMGQQQQQRQQQQQTPQMMQNGGMNMAGIQQQMQAQAQMQNQQGADLAAQFAAMQNALGQQGHPQQR